LSPAYGNTNSPSRERAGFHIGIGLIGLVCLLALTQPAAAQIFAGASPNGNGSIVLSNHASELAPEQFLAATEADATLPSPSTTSALQAVAQQTFTANAMPARTNAAASPEASVTANVITVQPAESRTLYHMIVDAAREHGVGADLIAAVAAAESRFNARALSPQGAQGIMQLMPATARRFGVQDVWSVEDNLRGGAAYLRWLLDFFGGDTTLAVAAYNAGEQSVVRAGRRIPSIEETRRYVPLVLAWRAHYARSFEPAANHARSPQPASTRSVQAVSARGAQPIAVRSAAEVINVRVSTTR
jgi:soluble lytic murein transglycosylase-like protein